VLVRCHAGCEQALVIAALRARDLWPTKNRYQAKIISPQQSRQPARNERDGDDTERTAAALRIWQLAEPAAGTLVEIYLQSRRINVALPVSLRFHPALRHPTGGFWPAMITLVTRGTDDEPVAIHRTFLARDGRGKAPVVPSKMMLGPVNGGAVRLATARPDDWLVLAEGLETTLSVIQACGLPGWATLSGSGLKGLILPREAAKVLICADNDPNDTGQHAAQEAAERFLREGRCVRVAMPPIPGTDFNDVLNLVPGGLAKSEVRHVA
jgi:putative DNA primase/helicase